MDLFVVPTLAFNLLYGFIIVRLDRRELVHIAVTNSPTADWIARQITEASPWDAAPGYLIRDRVASLAVVRHRVCAMGIRDKPIAPRSPWQNGFAERLIGSIRRECLDRSLSAARSICADSALVRELLQQSSDAPVTEQRRAGASSDSAPWRPKVISCSRWTTSPIRPNLVSGTDSVLWLGVTAHPRGPNGSPSRSRRHVVGERTTLSHP